MMWCMHLLLLAKANTQLVGVQLGRTAPPPATASHAAPPAAGELAASSPASLPPEIYQSAGRGELQKVASWLRKGGLVDALGPASTEGGQTETFNYHYLRELAFEYAFLLEKLQKLEPTAVEPMPEARIL